LPDEPLPPKPVPTRWGTWTEAVIFYSEYFETVKSIVAKFPSEFAVLVGESQSAFSIQKWPDQLPTCKAILAGFQRV
jgi:hypothetical protein